MWNLFTYYSWDITHVEEMTGFSMYTLVIHTEVEYQLLTVIEMEQVVGLMTSEKKIK